MAPEDLDEGSDTTVPAKWGVDPLNRRTLLMSSLLGAGIVGRADAARKPQEQVEIAAQALADGMRELHGGIWRVCVDHDAGLVVIIRPPDDHA